MNTTTATTPLFDGQQVITGITDASIAKSLPCGVIVGDMFGGRSFTDNVAAVLERRSCSGWREVNHGSTKWTIIVLVK